MLREITLQAWDALRRNPTRSILTMLGIVWGIVAVALLIAYGDGFRFILTRAFDAFGKSAVICWPGQTSEQVGGERAGKPVKFEKADIEAIKAEATLVKYVCMETVRTLAVSYQDRVVNGTVRGVCAEYGEIRNETAANGRWISPEDYQERRRVVFLGNKVKNQLFSGRPAEGETVQIGGTRFTVIGTMENKLQLSSYFNSDDQSIFIPYTAASEIWNTRYASVMVMMPVAAQFEAQAERQLRAAVAKRQGFSPTDKRSMQMFGRQEFRPVIDGITIGLKVLLLFIGILTLGIGGVGVMNIMLVSVNERVREIGLRRALGARRSHIRTQFLFEALAITLAGGAIGIGLAYLIASCVGTLPLLGTLFDDDSGRGDIRLTIDAGTILVSTSVLLVTGLLSGLLPAMQAAALDPTEALRYE